MIDIIENLKLRNTIVKFMKVRIYDESSFEEILSKFKGIFSDVVSNLHLIIDELNVCFEMA